MPLPIIAAILLKSRAGNSFVPETVDLSSVSLENSLSVRRRARTVGLWALWRTRSPPRRV